MLDALTKQLTNSESLSAEQVKCAVAQLIDEAVGVEIKADFLTALARKGETVEEIAAFARELRDKAVHLPIDAETRAGEIIDVCGTGGDHLRTFNISTTVAMVVASAGVAVAKHGNRAITSQSGSADVLEALGIKIDLTPEQAAATLQKHKFVFLFAPKYHPAFKSIGPVRILCKERGQRTIFNFLGPLLNPARPSAQLIGVPRTDLCEPMARVLQSLGIRRGMVVCGCVGEAEPAKNCFLDEFSTLGENHVAEFYQERGFSVSNMAVDNFPLQKATIEDLSGGDSKVNAEITRRILRGEERGPKRDAVLLNSAVALFVAGKTASFDAGWDLASELIDDGKAAAKLSALIAAAQT